MDHHQYITNESERKSGKHLTSEDRGAIQAMKKLNYSNRKIASYLHCSPTTVSNELKRGTPTKKERSRSVTGLFSQAGQDGISDQSEEQPQAPQNQQVPEVCSLGADTDAPV